MRHFAETDSAKAESADVSPRSTTNSAPIVLSYFESLRTLLLLNQGLLCHLINSLAIELLFLLSFRRFGDHRLSNVGRHFLIVRELRTEATSTTSNRAQVN